MSVAAQGDAQGEAPVFTGAWALRHRAGPPQPTARVRGLTLVELMVVLAIVAILSAVAYPSFSRYLQQSRRSDGINALSNIALQQEKYRTNNASYGTLANLGLSATSPDGYYTLALSSVTASTYTVTATATGSQTADTDCTVLTLTVNGNSMEYTPASCIKK